MSYLRKKGLGVEVGSCGGGQGGGSVLIFFFSTAENKTLSCISGFLVLNLIGYKSICVFNQE